MYVVKIGDLYLSSNPTSDDGGGDLSLSSRQCNAVRFDGNTHAQLVGTLASKLAEAARFVHLRPRTSVDLGDGESL